MHLQYPCIYKFIYISHMHTTIPGWHLKGRFIIKDSGYKLIFQKVLFINI